MNGDARSSALDVGERGLRRLQARYEQRLLRELREPLGSVLPADSSLLAMSEYLLSTGGKRLRAFLPLLTAECLGENPGRILPFGAACEILHNATLVHDDVQDGDRYRRGHETIWQRFGTAQAINLGDALFYQAVLLCQRLEATAELREATVRRLLLATLRTIDGQEREFRLKQVTDPKLDHYFEMVECKTSGLFALPLAGAAALCEAPDSVVEALESSARHLGILFQIQDDLLDIFGDKGRDRVGCDIAEGKRSILVIFALEAALPEERERLCTLLDGGAAGVGEKDVAWVRELFIRTGAQQRACAEIVRRRRWAVNMAGLRPAPVLRDLVDEVSQVFLSPIRDLLSTVEGIA